MKQLYAIRASGGSYDDAWETTKFVTDDLEKAEAYCAKMNDLAVELRLKKKEINEWSVQRRKDNPAPVCEKIVGKESPRWDSKTKVTVEMRAERKRIEDENRAAYQAAMQPYYDWNRRAYEEWIAWQEATYPAEILEGIKDNLDDSYWDVEPVDWLE
jgi:nitrous oxide reductase accessory protein NosL